MSSPPIEKVRILRCLVRPLLGAVRVAVRTPSRVFATLFRVPIQR
jgi:hypothetical protein